MATPQYTCNLTDLGLLKITGPDAKTFLQGQLTCHLDEITPETSRMGAHCNPQGRIISLFYLFQRDGAYYQLLPKTLLFTALDALKKYAVFYKVTLTNESDTLSITGCAGYEQSELTKWAATVIPLSPTSQRYIVIGQSKFSNYTELSLTQWKHLNLEEKLPSIYPETSGKFLPHELNLHQLNAIHFEKGCYTGQEIIARLHYRGKLKTTLNHATVTSATPLIPGTDIQSDHISGQLVDFCENGINQYQVLILT